jgi:Zn-dependent M28 family amino/carboxypeptidase
LSGNFDPAKAEIHNGADDNASGTAGVTELARVYAADPKPRRSLVFMAFTGEESGLLGSKHFVENPTIPLDKTVMMINMDMIGRNENRPIEVFGTKTAEEFESLVKKHAGRAGLKSKLSGGGTGPSDHTHFYRKEIPVLFAFTGLHTDYHKPTDDVDKIDYAGTVRVLEFVRSLADEIIASETRPTYKSGAGSAGPGRRAYRVTMGIMPSYGGGGDEPGWAVDGVIPERAAAKAGMKDGDRILTINGKKISGIGDYMDALADNQPGDVVEVQVKRGTSNVKLKVKLEGK